MRIENPIRGPHKNHLSGEKSRRPAKTRAAAGSLFQDKGTAPLRQREIAAQIDAFLNHVKSFQSTATGSLAKALPPLEEVLRILGAVIADPSESDLEMIEKFIDSWLARYGSRLPGRKRRELSQLANLLKGQRALLSENSIPLFSLKGEPPHFRNSWRVDFRKSSPPASESGESPGCTVEMTTENLGTVRAYINGSGREARCLFYSDDRQIRSFIRKSLNRFRSQLKRHGCSVPRLSVLRRTGPAGSDQASEERAVNLWG